jgi:tetratricopeptide (TPR) repeat protein
LPAAGRSAAALGFLARIRIIIIAASVCVCAASAAARSALGVAPGRDDYAERAFQVPFAAGLRAFYVRDFAGAGRSFERALAVIPDNTLALAFLNATALQTPGVFDALIDAEEDTLGKHPNDYLAHVRLGFSYLFATQSGRDRDADAREELNAAVALEPDAPAAHVGLGIMRESQRSMNRAKVEFLAALRRDDNNILAREYLAQIYQADLRDPQRGLAYVIDIPNLAPDYADIYYHIASLFDDLGQPDAALKYATLGLEKDIGHVGEAGQHGYTLLARVYLGQRKTADARRVLRAAIAANADAAFATTLLRKIDRGEYDPQKSTPPPRTE